MTEAEIAALREIILGVLVANNVGWRADSVADTLTQRLVDDGEFYYLPQKLPNDQGAG